MQQDQAVYEEMLRRGSRGRLFWLAGSRLRSAGLLGIVLLLLVWPVGLYFRIPDIWLILFLGLLAMAAVFSVGSFLKNISYRIALAEGLDLARCLAAAEPPKPPAAERR